ncbi:TPA: hypothetical protein DEO28_03885 [Candidatus Dependentiae bacterium]|nr:MAG: hypothetical protein UR14_C0006G0014 [candidate division TM6 bacterium GW2011_GWE2_31_21]KKP53563.1 MAG: hypothetical protein UR43_C0004G0104 [candidate division TM6 bacterium GW2011_GWF2_33_332]HBS48196.1 hypothetical protein [Candidatus Dependentiae bacterium]HBZ73622.1 hypothetical protein [Candidatus Dependentiae bacterium]
MQKFLKTFLFLFLLNSSILFCVKNGPSLAWLDEFGEDEKIESQRTLPVEKMSITLEKQIETEKREIANREGNIASLKRYCRIAELKEANEEFDKSITDASSLGKLYYKTRKLAFNAKETFEDARRSGYGLLGIDIDEEDRVSKEKSERLKQQRTILNPKNLILVPARVISNACAAYSDSKEKESFGLCKDDDYVSEFGPDATYMGERLAAAALEFADIISSRGASSWAPALWKTLMAGLSYQPNSLQVAMDKYYAGMYRNEPEFKNAWVGLVEEALNDPYLIPMSGKPLNLDSNILLYVPEHGAFIFDLVYPMFQVYLTWGILIPEMKKYLFYNILGYLIRYDVLNYFKLHQKDICIPALINRLVVIYSEVVASDVKILKKVKSVATICIAEIREKHALPFISEQELGDVIDNILVKVLGDNYFHSLVVFQYGSQYLKDVNFERFGEKYKFDLKNHQPSNLSDLASSIKVEDQIFKEYKQAKAKFRGNLNSKQHTDIVLNKDGLGIVYSSGCDIIKKPKISFNLPK